MSTDSELKIRERLRSEFNRLGLKAADVARELGEEGYKIRDLLSRTKLSVEMLSRLVVGFGIDGHYILTGQHNPHEISIDYVRAAFQMVADAEAQLPAGAFLSHEQRVNAVCSLLKTAQAVGRVPDTSAAIAVLLALQ